jgi:O-antigen/teichoic acid export membrane protein
MIFNLMGQALILGLGFWGTRLVFHRLGEDTLGILYFTIAMYAVLIPVLDLGVSSTVVREVASHLDTDPEYVVRLSRTSTLFYWVSYAVLAVAIWLAAPWLVSRWITLRTLSQSVAVQSLRILGLSFVLMLPRSLYSNLLRGVERMEFNNVIDVGTTALQQGGTILVVIRGGGLVVIAYLYMASIVLSNLAYIVTVSRFFSLRAFLPGFYRDVVRRNSSFTSRVGAYSLLAMVQMESDKAILSKLVSVGLLGFYGVAQSMVARVNRITGAVTQAAFPNLSALFHTRDHDAFIRQYRRLQDLVCYGTVPVFAGITFAAHPVFAYLLNAQAAKMLLWPTVLLCLGWYMNATLNIPAIVSLAAGRPDIGAWQNFYALFIVTPPTIVLIWKWGLLGASLSVVFYHLYAYSYGARRVSSECLGIRPRDWYLHVVKIAVLVLATYGVAWSVLSAMGQRSITSLACAYGLASVGYLGAAYLAMGDELRAGLAAWRQRIAGGLPRFSHSH